MHECQHVQVCIRGTVVRVHGVADRYVHAETSAGQGVHRGINIWMNLSAADKMYACICEDVCVTPIWLLITCMLRIRLGRIPTRT